MLGIKYENVLFIAFYYNPNNKIASKRLQEITKYLPKYGWNPIVLIPKTGNSTVKIKSWMNPKEKMFIQGK